MKRLLPLCLPLLLLTACAIGPKEYPPVPDHVDYATAAPPEDGWTTRELMSMTYLCGQRLTWPQSVEGLGDAFEVTGYSRFLSRSRLVPGQLCYRGTPLANVTVVRPKKETMLYTFVLTPQLCEVTEIEPFVINGVQMYDTMDDVAAALGEPDYRSEDAMRYDDRETGEDLYWFFFEDGELIHVLLELRFDIDLPLYRDEAGKEAT